MWQMGAVNGVQTTPTECTNSLPTRPGDFSTKMEEILVRTADPNVPPSTKTEEERKMSPGDLAMGANQNGGESQSASPNKNTKRIREVSPIPHAMKHF